MHSQVWYCITRTSAGIVVAALALICLGDLVQAASPAHAATDCETRMCNEQNGCGAPPSPQVVLPAAVLPVADGLVPVLAAAGVSVVTSRAPIDDPPLRLASRSPPTVAL
jgi:hypothetical protein